MVRFIQHGVLPMLRALRAQQRTRSEALNSREEMIKAGRFFPAAQQIAKRLVTEDMAEPVARLPEQLLTMGQKEKPGTTAGEGVAREIKGSNQGLASSGRIADKVTEEPSVDPFRLQPVERGLLVRMRPQIEEDRRTNVCVPDRKSVV